LRKLVCLFVLFAAAACSGRGGPNVEAELEESGFEIVSCEEAAADRFICELENGGQLQALVNGGTVFVVRSV
jgi:hypothetical protein